MSLVDQLTFRSFRGSEDFDGMAALISACVAEQGDGEPATADMVAVN